MSEDFNKNLEKNSREKFLTDEEAFDAIADLLEKNLDVNFLRGLMFQ